MPRNELKSQILMQLKFMLVMVILISSFLSPAVNKRTDEYGGTPEKRARLLVEIISQIKKEIEDFPILVRLDANEYRIENGITPDDFLITASLAQEAGADAIDVSCLWQYQ